MKRTLLILLILQASFGFAQQPNVYLNGTVTEGPAGAPVAFQPVFFNIQIGNDTLVIFTETVFTNDSGYYSYSFYLDSGQVALVEIATPECNGTMLVENLMAQPWNTYITDFNICSLFICQAFFSFVELDDQAFQFYDESIGQGLNYFWDFGDGGVSTDQNPYHLYNQPGVYDVCLTIFSGDSLCFDMFCQLVATGNTGGCMAQFTYFPDSLPAANAMQFIDLSSGFINSWAWDFGDGTTSTEPSPLHVFPEEGEYFVCLTISGPECQSTWCEMVVVAPAGDCYNYFTYQVSGTSVLFAGYHSTNLPASFTWDFGDGVSGEGQQAAHTYAGPGTYYVSLLSTDLNNCTAASSQVIVIGDSIIYNQVYGQVVASNFPLKDGAVTIISTSASAGFAPFTSTTDVDDNGVFVFPYIPIGEYILYAEPEVGNLSLPTYFGDVVHWSDAEKISTGNASGPLVISLLPFDPGAMLGTGSIIGTISSSGNTLIDLEMTNILLYNGSYEILAFSAVATEGSFSFSGLEAGTYYLYPELAGVNSSFMRVDLEGNNMAVEVHMNYNGNSILGEDELLLSIGTVQIFPNPAIDFADIRLECTETGQANWTVIDLHGRQCLAGEISLKVGKNEIGLLLADLKPGLYIFRITTSSGKSEVTRLIKM